MPSRGFEPRADQSPLKSGGMTRPTERTRVQAMAKPTIALGISGSISNRGRKESALNGFWPASCLANQFNRRWPSEPIWNSSGRGW